MWRHRLNAVIVSDPQKESEPSSSSIVPGSGTYVTYLVTTRVRSPDPAGFSVRRRFRDFVALADRLAESYRGYFIPPRPDKSLVESQVMQKQEFVEQRRSALEKYLVKLAAHPELKQSMTNDWGGGRPPAVEEDKEFLERKERVQELEQQLSSASQQAEALVKAQQDIGETMGELGLAFFKLGKFETEEAVYNSQKIRAADFKRLATAAVRASRSYRESNAQTVKHLDTLHEYLGLMLAVHGAFSDRSSALLTVQTLMSDLSSLHSRAEKLEAASSKIFGGDKTRNQKLEDLKETIRKTEDAKCCAIREYERIKENNRNELERFDRERHDDFLGMLKGFVINQVGYAEKNASIWAQVTEETRIYAKESS
ncbi:uncharacterized protein A4U43_C02F3350 [Asparagus officinalis]|uniref:PX domain-containing protein n=1 Tax=Asparagus officinalis TaxID=4686 RepID=A0A5P1FFH0_ASPOF|nr:uncharacterized protein A4U43_C02F3350 [Asparagus officinalis]